MFKKKQIEEARDGAKTFDGKINLIEFEKDNEVIESFSRPQVIEKYFDYDFEPDYFINNFRSIIDKEKNKDAGAKIYINGININQISKIYLDNEIKVIEEIPADNLELNDTIKAKLNQTIIDIDNLNTSEKIKIDETYKQNASVVIFKNFKMALKEKQYEILQNHLIDLFCDAIIIFVNLKK